MHKTSANHKKNPPFRHAGSWATDIVPFSLAERLLTTGEVAKMLWVSRSSVYYLIACGDLPAIRVGNMLRLQRRDVARYMQLRAVKVRRRKVGNHKRGSS